MTLAYRALVWLCGFWCHQIPERSPHLLGVQFPLCWRCTGIALGAMLLLAFIVAFRKAPGLWASLALAILMPADVFAAITGFTAGNNAFRFATGLMWGFFGVAASIRLIAGVVRRFADLKLRTHITSQPEAG